MKKESLQIKVGLLMILAVMMISAIGYLSYRSLSSIVVSIQALSKPDLRLLMFREDMLNLESMNPEISKDKKEEILKEIQLVRDLIDQNRKKLSSMNRQLRNSEIKIAGLQARIDSLSAHIAQSDKYMAELKMELVDRNFEIGQLNEKVSSLEVAMVDSSNKISRQTLEMNKAYVVSGTYKDLKEKGVLVKEGGVMGLGRKESLQENFKDEGLFTRVDISKTRTIQVNSKDAKLVTEHPAHSYELVKDGSDKIAYIEIKDPDAFWKISRYAVVEVNK